MIEPRADLGVRGLNGCASPLSSISREERNYAAILYALLLDEAHAMTFVRRIDPALVEAIDPSYFGVFFEYTYLRDLWANISGLPAGSAKEAKANANRAKVEFIVRALTILGDSCTDEHPSAPSACAEVAHDLRCRYEQCLTELSGSATFNAPFLRNPSKTDIQSPQTWQLARLLEPDAEYGPQLSDDAKRLLVYLGWCFRAKPDIVIHLNRRAAICVEIKVESGEGSYVIGRIRSTQTTIQRYVMRILGFETTFAFLSVDTRGAGKLTQARKETSLTWFDLFGGQSPLLPQPQAPFARDMIRSLLGRRLPRGDRGSLGDRP